jgi:hypothetical protein
MNHWLENSARNLLPLSKSDDFSEALGEWFFTGSVEDYQGADDDIHCELCEHPDLAHHYEIRNSFTERSLQVGSSCILKFSAIEIRDTAGNLITDAAERELELKRALRRRVIESALEPLRLLWQTEKPSRRRIEYLAKYLKSDSGVGPEDLIFLFTQMDSHGILYRASAYKVSIRTDNEKAQISRLSTEIIRKLAPALSKEQLKKIRRARTDV